MSTNIIKIRCKLFSISILFFTSNGNPIKIILASELYIAVASNFLTPINSLKQEFEGNIKLKYLSQVAQVSLYSQIINGAPLDIFLSGDQDLPKNLSSLKKALKEHVLLMLQESYLYFLLMKIYLRKTFQKFYHQII